MAWKPKIPKTPEITSKEAVFVEGPFLAVILLLIASLMMRPDKPQQYNAYSPDQTPLGLVIPPEGVAEVRALFSYLEKINVNLSPNESTYFTMPVSRIKNEPLYGGLTISSDRQQIVAEKYSTEPESIIKLTPSHYPNQNIGFLKKMVG